MPRVSQTRVLPAPRARIWKLVCDPHSLPRWWPRAIRVEDVRGQGSRMRWTTVLETDRGTPVRADFRCEQRTDGTRIAWAQEIEGTPFERILRSSSLSIELADAGDGATRVHLTSDDALRGISRLGSTMMRGAARRRLSEALDGIELAAVGERA